MLYLLSGASGTSLSATVRVLLLGLPRERFHVSAGVLGPITAPLEEELKCVGVAAHTVAIRHVLDLSGARRFRQLALDTGANLIHAFGPPAARVARLASSGANSIRRPRVVISEASEPGTGVSGWLTARQIRRADRVIAATRAEGDRYRGFHVPAEVLTRIAPAAPAGIPAPARSEVLAKLGLPVHARLIVASGTPERATRLKDAIVAFDMLRYDARDLHLVIFGVGAAAASLEQFGRALAFDDFRVHFPQYNGDGHAAIHHATTIMITDPWGGTDLALAAMAAGKPVIGWNTRDLAEVVEDRVTGYLVPLGDRAALAASGRILLDEPAKAAAMGAAGAARAAERFGAAKMIEQFTRVYVELGV
ncbi:MAG TPA: glycosyltransferase family 4 protein [Gemmata sp.]|nr:glycosyltransferase family 4 protein [Gemmata sp.]